MVCIIVVVVVSCELLSQLGRVPLTHILETWFEILMLACFASLLAKRCCPKILPGYYILHIQQLHSQYLYIFGRDLDLQIFEHDLAWVYPGFFLVKISTYNYHDPIFFKTDSYQHVKKRTLSFHTSAMMLINFFLLTDLQNNPHHYLPNLPSSC